MTKNPITLTKNCSIKKAAEVFLENKIDGAPVINNNCEILGIFTKKHLMQAVVNNSENKKNVSDFMTSEVITICETKTLEEAFNIEIGRLPVINKKNELVGIITRTDLVEAFFRKYRKTAQEYDTILNYTHNGIISINLDSEIENCNQAAKRMLNDSLVGKKVTDILPNSNIDRVLKTGKKELGKKFEINNKTFITNRSPLYKNGKLYGAIAVFQDVSELEEISAELDSVKNLNKELDAIIDSVSDGIYITDGNADTIRINESYERITGIKSEEVIGRNMKDLVAEGVFSESVTFKVFEKRKPASVMHNIKTGQQVLSTGHPVFNEDGEIVRVVTTARDVKKLNDLKEELNKTKELSKQYYSELQKLRLQQLELNDVVIKSSALKDIFDLAIQLGTVDSTVLITGESGVGKEIVARTIHKVSERSDNSLIKVNCGAIPPNLLEAELFGYEEGAFTGAKSGGKPGMFELANGGTLFLDEIAELPLDLQVKLLRVLQEHELIRVGGTKNIKIDARIITATNRDLEKMMKEDKFREDLYYRLNVVPIFIPPLRKRREDISQLSYQFLFDFNEKYNKNKKLSQQTVEILENYKWPGNVRELKNLIERIVVMSNQDLITPDFLPNNLKETNKSECEINIRNIMPLKKAVSELESQILKKAFKKYKTTYQVAEALEVSQPTVVRKKNKYELEI